jgi:hypothetical protein
VRRVVHGEADEGDFGQGRLLKARVAAARPL